MCLYHPWKSTRVPVKDLKEYKILVRTLEQSGKAWLGTRPASLRFSVYPKQIIDITPFTQCISWSISKPCLAFVIDIILCQWMCHNCTATAHLSNFVTLQPLTCGWRLKRFYTWHGHVLCWCWWQFSHSFNFISNHCFTLSYHQWSCFQVVEC